MLKQSFNSSKIGDAEMRRLIGSLQEMVQNGTPNQDGTCKQCGGRVIKRVSSFMASELFFSTPECEKCGRQYSYADKRKVPSVGVKEFYRGFKESMTI